MKEFNELPCKLDYIVLAKSIIKIQNDTFLLIQSI